MARNHPIEPSQYVFRYTLALLLIVLLVVGGHGLHLVTGKQGALDEETLNLSGRQRMLSQRIAFLSHRYSEEGSEEYRARLEESLEAFQRNHDWIMSNAVTPGTAIELHYLGATGPRLDERMRSFADLALNMLSSVPGEPRAIAQADQLESVALSELLRDLNEAVTLFERAANQRAVRLAHIQMWTIIATLLVLTLEVLLIFYPAHVTIVGMVERLRFQAWHDQMTGLTNRAKFLARVGEMMDEKPSKLDRMFILALDLDGFKDINDTLGHPVGDQVLQHVARLLETKFSEEPTLEDHVLARFGGDEFLACCLLRQGEPAKVAHDLGDALIAAIEAPVSVSLGTDRVGQCIIGASIGYALGEQADGSLDTFVSNADIALYESKRRGKGVATAFERTMRETAETWHALSTELKAAIRGLEFRAFLQPQICLDTGAVKGVEALARWDHPSRGLVGPTEFMALAEESRLIDALDGQIMLEAFEAFRRCMSDGLDLGSLSLNASGLALRDPDFCDLLYNVAQAHLISPAQVTVEVLENILIQEDTDPAMETIRKLASAGFGIAVDDFGVGYSSLSRISHGEITAIKIDRSMVQQCGIGKMDKILAATAAMARGINASLLAEGIETDEQRMTLKALGVQVGQGYLWSRPVPVNELRSWMVARQRPDLKLVSG